MKLDIHINDFCSNVKTKYKMFWYRNDISILSKTYLKLISRKETLPLKTL